MNNVSRTRAQISTNAIERIYITMRHLFITYDRSIPSLFLDLLSEERWLKLA
jgi:hypothetical protein